MREHVINIQLKITARDWISRADLITDLRKQLAALQEQPPYRHVTGSGWWTNSPRAVAVIDYADLGEQLEYEAEAGLRPWPTHRYAGSDKARQEVGDPGHCEKCAQHGHVKAHPDLGCGDVGCFSSHED